VATALAVAGIRHALVGGQAVNLYTAPRFTWDVDFLVEASPGKLEDIVKALGPAGFAVTPLPDDSAFARDFVRLARREGAVLVDLQPVRTDYERLVLSRAAMLDDSLPFPVATPEDLVVMKLVGWRYNDRRDLPKLLSLLALDRGYIEEWANTWQVTGRLEQVLRDVGQLEAWRSP
jgi:hypothetical protein